MKDPKTIADDVVKARYNGDLPPYNPATALGDEPSVTEMLGELIDDEVSVHSLIVDAATAGQAQVVDPSEQWGTMPFGVFGPEGTPVSSKEAAEQRTAGSEHLITPVVRSVFSIGGVEFATRWVRKPTDKQFEKYPKWKENLS